MNFAFTSFFLSQLLLSNNKLNWLCLLDFLLKILIAIFFLILEMLCRFIYTLYVNTREKFINILFAEEPVNNFVWPVESVKYPVLHTTLQ